MTAFHHNVGGPRRAPAGRVVRAGMLAEEVERRASLARQPMNTTVEIVTNAMDPYVPILERTAASNTLANLENTQRIEGHTGRSADHLGTMAQSIERGLAAIASIRADQQVQTILLQALIREVKQLAVQTVAQIQRCDDCGQIDLQPAASKRAEPVKPIA